MKNKLAALMASMLVFICVLSGCNTDETVSIEAPVAPDYSSLMMSGYSYDAEYADYVSNAPGLINPFIVGVNKDAFENEILYPVPEGGNAIVIDTTDREYGVTANDGKDDSFGIQKAIKKAASLDENVTKIIRLPKGRIDIIEGGNGVDYEYGLVFNGLKNVVLDGNGADIMLSCFLGMSGFFIKNCENIGFNDFTVDYTVPPYMMGKITHFDKQNKTITVKINEGYHVDTNAPVIQYVEYDPISKLPKASGNYLYINQTEASIKNSEYIKNADGSYSVKITAKNEVTLEDAIVNTPVALGTTFYVAQLFLVEDNKDVTFETVSVYSAWGMTVKGYNNENLYFNRLLNICKPGTDRLFTASADVLHLKNTKGKIKITNSVIENSHDDAINIGGHMLQVYEVDAVNKKVKVAYNSGMWGTFRPEIGEKFEIADSSDMIAYATVTVRSVEYAGGFLWLTFEETFFAETDDDYFDIGRFSTTSRLSNATRVPEVEIRNNVIRNKRNRGILIQSRNGVVENNLFSNIVHGAIMLVSDDVEFFESITPQDIIIRNNKFIRNGALTMFGDIDACVWTKTSGEKLGAIKNITIENNFFGESYNASVSMRRVTDFTIRGNAFYRSGFNNLVPESNTAVYIEKADRILLERNECVSDADLEFKSVIINGKLAENAVVLTGNSGMELDEGIVLETLNLVKYANNTVNVDGELTEWTEAGTSIKMAGATNGATNIGIAKVDESSFTSESKVICTEEGLYFMFKVIDDRIEFIDGPWYNGDFVEIFITDNTTASDMTDNFDALYPEAEWLQIYMSNYQVGFVESRTCDSVLAKRNEIVYSFKATPDGYRGEIFLPFEMMPKIGAAISAGNEISFSVTFGDCDDPSNITIVRVSSVNYPLEENKRTPATMGKLRCGE